MFDRVLLDNEHVAVYAPFFGIGSLKVVMKERNITLDVSREEQKHLNDVLEVYRKRNIEISPNNPAVATLMAAFVNAIAGGEFTSGTSPRWETFFRNSPEKLANRFTGEES